MKKLWQQILDRKRWPRFIRRVNVSYRRIKRGEVLTFLLFVAISAFFWTVQTAREIRVRDFLVDLEISDQPQDMVFTTHVPSQLRVSISDTNTKLFNYGYNNRLQKLTVNFERYADAVGDFRISAAELQSLLSAELMNTTRIVSVSPSLVDARFAQTEGRKFAVKVNGLFTPAENYRLQNIKIEPDSVTINAPSSMLDTLRFVYTAYTSKLDLRDTLKQTLKLDLPLGAKATPAKVKVTVPVVQYVEKTFDQIELHVTDEPRGKHLVVFPYTIKVTCLVDFGVYRDITNEMFEATVSYTDLINGGGEQSLLPIRVNYIGPSDVVTNMHAIPSTAEFVVE